MAKTSNKHVLSSGATRSETKPEYHLVPLEGFRRTAQRFGLGAKIHGPENWRKALQTEATAKEWCDAAYDHMMDHALKMANHMESDDDHLGAIGWAQSVLCHVEAVFGKPWTELNRDAKGVLKS